MATFTPRPLYGGALSASLPESYKDVSLLRQVPDNQEVFIDPDGYTSIIVDILERVAPAPSDPTSKKLQVSGADVDEDWKALEKHLIDIFAVDGASLPSGVNVYERESVEMRALELQGGERARTCSCLATDARTSSEKDARGDLGRRTRFTAIWVLLVRLAAQETDLVVSINIPVIPDESSVGIEGDGEERTITEEEVMSNPMVGAGRRMRDEFAASFEVRDWGLFG